MIASVVGGRCRYTSGGQSLREAQCIQRAKVRGRRGGYDGGPCLKVAGTIGHHKISKIRRKALEGYPAPSRRLTDQKADVGLMFVNQPAKI
jgi:hypothetical protein